MGGIISCPMTSFSRDCAVQRLKISGNSSPSSVQIVRRYFSPLIQMNHHLEDVSRTNSVWMMCQNRWFASVCISWVFPLLSTELYRVAFVILCHQQFDGNLCVFTWSILRWSWDQTVDFCSHSRILSRFSPLCRYQSLVLITNHLKPRSTRTQELISVSVCITLLDSRPRTDTRVPLRPGTVVRCWGVRKILSRTCFDTFIEDQNSHLFELSGPRTLDRYRLETPSGLRAN